MTPPNILDVAAVVYVVLSLAVLGGLVYGTARAARRVARIAGALLGGDAKLRLLGLAVTAVLFTPLINRVVRALLNLGVLLVERVPRQLLANWRTQADVCMATATPSCLGDTLLVPLKATGAGIASAFRESGLLSIGLGYVVFMLALWALATHTLNVLTRARNGEERIDIHDLLLDKDFRVARQNILFFLILFVGAYLSLASIAAIPDLRQEEGGVPTALSGAMLAENLGKAEWGVDLKLDFMDDPLALADSILYPGLAGVPRGGRHGVAADTPAAPPRDTSAVRLRVRGPGAPAGTTVPADGDGEEAADDGDAADRVEAEGTTAAGDEGGGEAPADSAAADSVPGNRVAAGAPVAQRISPAIPAAQVLALRSAANDMHALWIDQTVRHDSVLRGLARRRTLAQQLAQSAYAVSDTTRRLREQRTYYYRLQRWYLEAQMELKREYDESWVSLRRLHRRQEAWSAELAGYLTGTAPDTAQFTQLRHEAVRLRGEDWLLAERPPAPPYRLPERGAGLGPFQYVSGWLLKTDSMPLTLIVGMMGFGLLGAAASTFVREQSRRERREARHLRRQERLGLHGRHRADEMREPGDHGQPLLPVQPLVINLPSVVIRGGSAAIVVFLGLMGGLSVLTQEADPNPYALLFTCLAGAVFSEKVWSWAEKRFGLNLDSSDEEDDGDDARPRHGQDPAAGEDGGGGGGGDENAAESGGRDAPPHAGDADGGGGGGTSTLRRIRTHRTRRTGTHGESAPAGGEARGGHPAPGDEGPGV